MMIKRLAHVSLCAGMLAAAGLGALGAPSAANAASPNLLAGKSYTASSAANSSYPDSGAELTDGIYAAPLLASAGWQGRLGVTGATTYSFTTDLGTARTFQSFKTDFFKYTGGGVETPVQVAYEYSNDNLAYSTACSVNQQGTGVDIVSVPYSCGAASPISARYVRATVTGAVGKWSFIDEWEVNKPAGAAAPLLSGSFLQPDLGDAWTSAQWTTEFQRMEEVGIDHLFLQWSANSKSHTAVYPTGVSGYAQNTSTDVVAKTLAMGNQFGVDIYMGLQLNEDWFVNYTNNATWLNNEAAVAQSLAQDLWTKYGSNPSFKGWYLSFEVDNWNLPTSTEWAKMATFYDTVIDALKTLTPSLPVIVSPFYNTAGGLTTSGWQTMWEYILSNAAIDVIALQDGIGAGHATTAQLAAWFSATKAAITNARPATALWDDAETFNLDFKPMDIKLLKDDLAAVQPYVSKYTSFSFNHYISPQQVNPLYFTTYKSYFQTGAVDASSPTAPSGLTATSPNSMTVQLNWTASTDNTGVVGYKIYRNSELVYTAYTNATSFTDGQLAPSTAYSYAIRSFDAAGNESASSPTVSATTAAGTVYATNLAAGQSYSASTTADASYPDTGAAELTNGAFGTATYTDAAWQGRNTASAYSFTIDLGSSKTIKEIYADFLQVKSVYVLLPASVTFSVSSTGASYTPIGTVAKPAVGSADQTKKYRLTDLSGVSGRYVKVEVTPASSAWTFIDEVQVRN
ncbi:DUF4434 domain-containing protein [Cohnella hashimotonis]|uniref:DUF4434 domain-containing protein n=1 Tax=Cohnella hashimotonis TaxID=2826895 RepID=A0ABT6TPS6_9BACL|nr:DUF4434 domain-containing protein [Cohnella hashimotonis]MDI4648853.1 DUF4434 domain-containing protein [Cohnella hashimotonis]